MSETDSLKSLSHSALERLERNKAWNKTETKSSNLVSRPQPCETKNCGLTRGNLSALSSLSEAYEERLAIAEYDGYQTQAQAQRVADLDAFVAVLNAFPYEEISGGEWLKERVKVAQEWLLEQGLR